MMASIHPILRRLLALALLAVPVAGLYILIIAPTLAELDRTRAAIDLSREQLVRYRQMAYGLVELQAQLDEARRRERNGVGLLEGSNEALVGAELQARIKALAERNGAELRSVQILPPRDDEKLRKITVRTQLSLAGDSLPGLLAAIEASTPFLFIEALDIRARPTRAQAAAAAGEGGIGLEARIDASGYMRGQSP